MSSMRVIEVTISEAPPLRLDKALARDLPESVAREAGLSRSRLARLIAAGAVTRGGEALTDPAARIGPGPPLLVAVETGAETALAAEAIPLDVIHEDADLIVVNKPAGMVVHPGPGNPSGTLVNALLGHCGAALSGIGGERRPGIVHRIDKDTSGLLVAAKTDRAHHGLAKQFAAHSVGRRYQALCHGRPDAGDARLRGLPGVAVVAGGGIRIATAIGRHPHDRQRQAVLRSGGRAAVTHFSVVAAWGASHGLSLLECRLETGRTHQIRVHLAYAGHALIGDPVYGGARKLSAAAVGPGIAEAAAAFPRQALHAADLAFTHPVTGRELAFTTPLPADMAALIGMLRRADVKFTG